MSKRLRFATLAACILALPASADPSSDLSVLGAKAVQNHIRPAYGQLETAFTAMDANLAARCEAAQTPQSPEVDAAFTEAVAAWAGVQHLRIGPALAEDRYLSVFFWPDPKDFTGRHLGDLEVSLGDLPLEAQSLAQMSVAVQGLMALERVLYGDAGDSTLPTCALAQAIAGSLKHLGEGFVAGWAEGAPYPEELLSPGPDKILFRNEEESATELYKAMTGGLEQLVRLKLTAALGDSVEDAKPNRAAFMLSDLTLLDMKANVVGLRAYYLEAGFSEAVQESAAALDARIIDRFDQLLATLEAIEGDFAQAAVDPDQRRRWDYIRSLARALQEEMAGAIGGVLGLRAGFNSLDGD